MCPRAKARLEKAKAPKECNYAKFAHLCAIKLPNGQARSMARASLQDSPYGAMRQPPSHAHVQQEQRLEYVAPLHSPVT